MTRTEIARQLRKTLAVAGFDLGTGRPGRGDPIEVFRRAALGFVK